MFYKRKIISLILILCIILFNGCLAEKHTSMFFNGYDLRKNVKLCDYKDIKISKSFTDIDDEDIKSIIQMDMSANNFYIKTEKSIIETGDIVLVSIKSDKKQYNIGTMYYEVGSESIFNELDSAIKGKKSEDFCEVTVDKAKIFLTTQGIYALPDVEDKQLVTDFYEMKNYEDVEKFIKNRSYSEIIYNYIFDYIMENSEIIKYPKEVSENIEKHIADITSAAESENMTVEEYLQEIGLSEDEIRNSVIEYYSQYIFAEAVLDWENKMIDLQEVEELRKDSDGYKTIDTANESDDFQEKYFDLLLEVLRSVIVESTQVVD